MSGEAFQGFHLQAYFSNQILRDVIPSIQTYSTIKAIRDTAYTVNRKGGNEKVEKNKVAKLPPLVVYF